PRPRAAGLTSTARMQRMKRGMTIDGARVLITGAGSGIGRLMALDAAARGAAEILIWDLSADSGDAVRDEITAVGGQARSFEVNVADSAQVDTVAERTGPVDILINCAGIVTGKKLLDADADAIRRVYDVNTLALYWTTKAFLPGMLERDRGAVVTIASAAGLTGVARQTDYSASKWAAVGFTESLRSELRAEGSGGPRAVAWVRSWSAPSTSSAACSTASARSSPACCRSSRRPMCPHECSTPSSPVASSWSCLRSCDWCRECACCPHAPSTRSLTSSASTRPWTTSPVAPGSRAEAAASVAARPGPQWTQGRTEGSSHGHDRSGPRRRRGEAARTHRRPAVPDGGRL